MRLTNVAFAASVAAVPVSADDCVYSLQVLQLQDASDSFKDDVVAMVAVAGDLVGNITNKYPGSKYGLSSFIDKPVVKHGYGPYGGWGDYNPDYCYRSHIEFTTDVGALQDALTDLSNTVGSGWDGQENQMEAFLYAAQDKSIPWAPPDQTHDAEGRPIVRLVIMITDAAPHLPGDYAGTTTSYWDWPRTYTPNTIDGNSTGGFGADDFWTTSCLNLEGNNLAEYAELSALFHKIDFNVDFTSEEQARYDTLMAKFGPNPWPEYITEHPGTIGQDCSLVEYPSVELTGRFLRGYNIFPVILVAHPVADDYNLKQCPKHGYDVNDPEQLYECVSSLYNQYMAEFGTTGYVGRLDSGSNIVEVVMDAISQVVDQVCVGSTPAPIPIPATLPGDTTANGQSTSNDGTTANGQTTASDGTTANGQPTGNGGTTANGQPTGNGGTTTVPVAAGGGSNTAVIAAAGAGAAALIAAAGAFGYMKWGGAGARKEAGDAAADGEVDVPETQVERETVEEVTMDMFQ